MTGSAKDRILLGLDRSTAKEVAAIVDSYMELKRSYPSSFDYGFSCEECSGSVVARDRKKLVRNGASRTLCWECMAGGADLYAVSTQTDGQSN